MTKTLVIIVASLVLQLYAATVSAQAPDDIRDSLKGRGHALLIGVSTYDDLAWPKLASITADLDDLAKGLAPHFATVDKLLDPTTETIRNRLRDFMTGRWNRKDERLLIYYAGHGFTDYNNNSRIYTGYITGKDTPACHGADCDEAIGNAISFYDLDSLNRMTRALQVVTLFDSCFSGLAVVKGPENADATHYAADRAREEIRKPSRYYITAGGPTEEVPADSPFASLILKGLNGAADFWQDGFISVEELGIYLQRNVPIYARRPLHPQRSTIADETARLSSGQFMFLTGLITTPSPSKANPANPAATVAEQGYAAYLRKDYGEAARLYRLAANRGNAASQTGLGILYEQGLGGLPKDDREAGRFYRFAANQGEPVAQTNLGVFYSRGRGGLPMDDREAARLYRLAADQGYATGQRNLGNLYQLGGGGLPQDDREAARLFRLAADQGEATGQTSLGVFYEKGRGGLPQDDREAARLYRLAADQGEKFAQTSLGRFYVQGRGGLPEDEGEATRLNLAADQGEANAHYNLGLFYEAGYGGLPKDDSEAVRLYQMAARNGQTNAQRRLRELGKSW